MGKVLLEQWVNLPRDAKWVDGTIIKDIDRVGPLHYEVESKNPRLLSYKIKVQPQSGNTTYNTSPVAGPENDGSIELYRNKAFEGDDKGADTNLGKKKHRQERDVYLPAAGGNEYVVRVKDKKTTVESTKAVMARRILYYYSVRMNSAGLAAGKNPTTNAAVSAAIDNPTAMLSGMEAAYWDFSIKLVRLDDSILMKLHKTMVMAEHDLAGAVVGNAGAATQAGILVDLKSAMSAQLPELKKRKGFCFVALWANYIAKKGKKIIEYDASTSGALTATIPSAFKTKLFNAKVASQDITISLAPREHFWHGLNDADDLAKNWIEDIEVFFKPQGSTVKQRLHVPKARISIDDNPKYAFGGHSKLKVHLDDAAFNGDPAGSVQGIKRRIFGQIQGEITVRITVRVVVGFLNGFSMGGTNAIVVADKVRWSPRKEKDKAGTLNHEFGHKIGMTAQGGKKKTFGAAANLPDAPATLYGNIHTGPKDNSRNHQGPHCEKGAVWAKSTYNPATKKWQGNWSGDPLCVMFGEGHDKRPTTYCDVCKPIAKKLDLGASMTGFKQCVSD
jgi:hypothetical protein